MAKLTYWREIFIIGILTCLLAEVSAYTIFYTKLNITSLNYNEVLKNRTSAEFIAVALKTKSLIFNALTANASNTLLTNETVFMVQVQQFRPGTVAVILIAVQNDPLIEEAVNNTLTVAVEDGKLGQETVEASSLEVIQKQSECYHGYVIDFNSGDCVACPIGTFQDPSFKGQCDSCPLDTSTVKNASVGAFTCRNFCSLDFSYCNGGICTYQAATGVLCNCPSNFQIRIGGKRCEPLVTFYLSFNITSQAFSDQLKNKSSQSFTNVSMLVENLVTNTLVSSNNSVLTKDKVHNVHLLTFEPGLNAAFQIDVVNASTIKSAITSVMTSTIQSGKMGQQTVQNDSLIIIDKMSPCAAGSIMDFQVGYCVQCPIGTYEPFGEEGQCENCPVGTNTSFSGTSGRFRCSTFCNLNVGFCKNGGTCNFVTQQGENFGGRCFCPFDYTGKNCETALTVVLNVQPQYGPEAGGSNITISGVHFKIANDLDVAIGGSPCTNVTGNETLIFCQTGQFNKSAYSFREKLDMTITYTNPAEVAPVAKGVYSYRRNPRVTEIKPLATFISGGLLLTVIGSDMDGVVAPKLLTEVSYDNTSQSVIKSDCSVETNYMLLCRTPNILNKQAVRGKRSAATQRVKRQSPLSITSVKIGFEFDGLTTYQDLSTGSLASYSTVAIYPDPTVEKFDPQIQSYNEEEVKKLIIKGNNFNPDSVLSSLYRVMIGKTDCYNLQIRPTELECDVPKKPSNYSNYAVTVKIGQIEHIPGYLKYKSGFWNDDVAKYAIVGSALGAALVVVLAVAAWILVSTTKFIEPIKGKDSHTASLVGDNTSESLESIIPNPIEGYVHEDIPNFSSARFYTSTSRGRAYDNPSMGSPSNSHNFMY